MNNNDDIDDRSRRKLVELAASPVVQQSINEMSKTLVRLKKDCTPVVERLVELQKSMQWVNSYHLRSVNMAYESIKRLAEPASSVLAFQKSAIGTLFDNVMRPSFLDSIKTMMNMSTRYQDMMKDMAWNRPDYFSMISVSPLVDTLYETPIYRSRPEPPTRRDSPITHVHVNVHIERLIVHRDGRPAVAVPEGGCTELDPYFYLCYKQEEKKYGVYYYKNGGWNFEELTPLQARLLHYLYDVGFHVHTYAQKLDTIANALQSSKVSISNRINELEKIFEQLKIQDLLAKIGEDRWCLSRQLGCFEGTWL